MAEKDVTSVYPTAEERTQNLKSQNGVPEAFPTATEREQAREVAKREKTIER